MGQDTKKGTPLLPETIAYRKSIVSKIELADVTYVGADIR